MFHRVTTEDQEKSTTQKQPANTNATATAKPQEAAPKQAPKARVTTTATPQATVRKPQERALFGSGKKTTNTTQPVTQNTPATQKPTTQNVVKSTPTAQATMTSSSTITQKRSYAPSIAKTNYSTPKTDRGTTMTSYSRTPSTDTSGDNEKPTHDFSAGTYSRARSSTGGYPGSSSYAAGVSGGRTSSKSSDNDRTLTIGAGITMAGEIESCDYLLVEGTVEAALKGARSLEIAESGVFYGTVEIEEATIAGRFEGDITVHGRLTILSSGIVTGTITYKELEIEGGAIVDGRLTPVASTAQTQTPAPVSTKTRSKSSTSEKNAANTDGALFEKDIVAAE